MSKCIEGVSREGGEKGYSLEKARGYGSQSTGGGSAEEERAHTSI